MRNFSNASVLDTPFLNRLTSIRSRYQFSNVLRLAPKLALSLALAVSTFGLALSANAADQLAANSSGTFGPSIPIDDPTFCFGENNLGQCVLFFGSANSCANTVPCNSGSSPSKARLAATIGASVLDVDGDTTWCYGADDLTGQCTLFVGPKSSCDNIDPCAVPVKRAPRTLSR